jgi:hypothetical protein
LYGSEIWTLEETGIRGLKTAEMKFVRCVAGYSLLDLRRNEDILQELKRQAQSKRNLHSINKNHVSRMENIRYLKQLLVY